MKKETMKLTKEEKNRLIRLIKNRLSEIGMFGGILNFNMKWTIKKFYPKLELYQIEELLKIDEKKEVKELNSILKKLEK